MKAIYNFRKAEDAATRIESLEAQLLRTKEYFVAYAMTKGDLSYKFNGEIPGFNNSINDIFNEVDRMLRNK